MHLKGEIGEKLFCQEPLAIKSKSGLKICLWMFRLIEAYSVAGVMEGPMFWKVGKV
jgi:hypothetical protein